LFLTLIFTSAVFFYVFKKGRRINNVQDGFFIFGSIAYLSTIGLLIFLSLTLDKHIGAPLFIWTYVMEARYFTVPVFFTQVCLWWYFFVQSQKNKAIFIRWFRRLFILLMAIEMVHGMYFVAKKISQGVMPFQDIPYESPEQAFVIQFIRDMRQKDPSRKVVVTGFSKKYGFMTGLYGASGMFTPLALNHTLPKSSRPAVLLMVIRKKEVFLLDSFLKQAGVQLLREINEFCLYTYYVEPNSGNIQ
jgi:hypothetical protein